MQPKLNKKNLCQLPAWNPRRIKPSEDFTWPKYHIDLSHAIITFFPQLWLTKPCFQILASCFTSQQIPCNSEHPPPQLISDPFKLCIHTYPMFQPFKPTPLLNLHSHQTHNFWTPTSESLTFVVTLLDQVAWLYSGYCLCTHVMINSQS